MSFRPYALLSHLRRRFSGLWLNTLSHQLPSANIDNRRVGSRTEENDKGDDSGGGEQSATIPPGRNTPPPGTNAGTNRAPQPSWLRLRIALEKLRQSLCPILLATHSL